MIETIALGRPDPVSGANPYRFFHLPVVNRSGDISFVADTSSNLTIPAVHSVFTMPSGGAIEGRLVSGSGGFLTIPQVLLNRSEFSTNQFRDPYVPLADDGTNYALAGLNLIGSGILAADGNGFAFLVQDGGSAPGTGGKVFTDFTDAPFTAIRTNAQSDVAFIGVLANSGSPNTPSGVGIFEVSEGISVLAAAPGNAVSGAGTLQGISFAALSFNATREVAFIGTLGSNNSAIIRQDGASLTGIAIQGEVAPGMNSATIQIVGFDSPGHNASGQVAFAADLFDAGGARPVFNSQQIDGVFARSPSQPLEKLLARGDSAAGWFDLSTVAFSQPNVVFVGAPQISDSGHVIFEANAGSTILGNAFDEALFRVDLSDMSHQRIAQADHVVPDSDYLYSSFQDFAVNDNGFIAFTAQVVRPGEDTRLALLAEDENGNVQLIATVGSAIEDSQGAMRTITGIDFVGGSTSSGHSTGFNNDHLLTFVLQFGDGSGVFSTTIEPLPVDDFIWSGDLGTDNWHDAAGGGTNWNNRQTGNDALIAPGGGASDKVRIEGATVRIADRAVSLYSIDATGLLTAQMPLTIEFISFVDNLALQSDLTIANQLFLEGDASSWTSGSINGDGNVQLEGVLTLGGGETLALRTDLDVGLLASLNLDGAMLHLDGGAIGIDPDGLFEIKSGAVTSIGPDAGITNSGAIVKSGGGSATIAAPVVNEPARTVSIQDGVLELAGGGQLSGTVNVASGAMAVLRGGSFTLGDLDGNGFALTGAGTTSLRDAALILLDAQDIVVVQSGIDGGLKLEDGAATLGSGILTAANGGRISVAPDGIASVSNVLFAGQDGIVSLDAGTLDIGLTGRIEVSAGNGELRLLSGRITGFRFDGSIISEGTITKSTDETVIIDAPLTSLPGANFAIEAGTLTVTSSLALAGMVELAEGTSLLGEGGNGTVGGMEGEDLSIIGPGKFRLRDYPLQLADGSDIVLSGNGTTGGLVLENGGGIGGGGKVIIGDGGLLLGAAPTAADLLVPVSILSGGVMRQQSGAVSLGASGGIDIAAGGELAFEGGSLTVDPGAAQPVEIINRGLVSKTGGATARAETRFSNVLDAVIETKAGTLELAGGGVLNGTAETEMGADLRLTGDSHLVGSEFSVSGAGRATLADTTLDLIGGSLIVRLNGFAQQPSARGGLVIGPGFSTGIALGLVDVKDGGRLIFDSGEETAFGYDLALAGDILVLSGTPVLAGIFQALGLIDVAGGVLSFSPAQGKTQTLTGNSLDVAAGAAIRIGGEVRLESTVRLEGSGELQFSQDGVLEFAPGAEFRNSMDAPLQLTGGTWRAADPVSDGVIINDGEIVLQGGTFEDIILVNGLDSGAGGTSGIVRIDGNAPVQTLIADGFMLKNSSSGQIMHPGPFPLVEPTGLFQIENSGSYTLTDGELAIFADDPRLERFFNFESGTVEMRGVSQLDHEFTNLGTVFVHEGARAAINFTTSAEWNPFQGINEVGGIAIADGKWLVAGALDLAAWARDSRERDYLPVNLIGSRAEVILSGPDARLNQLWQGKVPFFVLPEGKFTLLNSTFSVMPDVGSDFFNLTADPMNFLGIPLQRVQQIESVTFINQGNLTISEGASLVANGTVINAKGATTKGSVRVKGNFFNANLLEPGDSPGIATIEGDFTNYASGIVQIEIGGLDAGTGYDQLIVTGNSLLEEGSRFEITFIDPDPNDGIDEIYMPGIGDSFEFLVTDSLTMPDDMALADFVTFTNAPAGFSLDFTAVEIEGATRIALAVGPDAQPPMAVDDTIATLANTAISFATAMLLANDSVPNGDPLSVTALGSADNGMVLLDGDSVTYTPDAGFSGTDSFTYTISDGAGGTDTGNVIVTVSSPPASTQFSMFTAVGFSGGAGGSGKLFGTNGFQDIAVIDVPGTFALDPSFNRGGDILRLEGSAADWSVVRIGSSALFSDGDTFVTVPVGSAGLPVVFDDGVRELKFDNVAGGFTIGGDPFGFGTFVPVDAAPDGTPLPTGSDPTAKGVLFLAAGAGASAAGVVDIFGTSSAEPVSLISGTITLDPSFNRGGDTVRFDELATDFTATRTGSSILLDGSDTQALVPVGTAGATLTFGNGSDMRVIQFDGTIPGFVIGTQVIGFDPVQLTAA